MRREEEKKIKVTKRQIPRKKFHVGWRRKKQLSSATWNDSFSCQREVEATAATAAAAATAAPSSFTCVTPKINVCLVAGVFFSSSFSSPSLLDAGAYHHNHQVCLGGNGSVKLINSYSLSKANEMRAGIRGRPRLYR